MKRAFWGAALVAALIVVVGGSAANLPGGTPIAATITTPADGALLPLGDVTLTGTASVGAATPVKDTTLIYVLDVSGSTASAIGGAPNRCPNQNVWDNLQDTTLDCELLAIRDLNQSAIDTGTVAQIGMIAFAGDSTGSSTGQLNRSAAILDLSPVGAEQPLAAPDAHLQPTPGGTLLRYTPSWDLGYVLQSAYVNGVAPVSPGSFWGVLGADGGHTKFTAHDVGVSTNFTAAVMKLNELRPSISTPKTVVAFISDGQAQQTVAGTTFQNQLNLVNPTGLEIYTFAIGSTATCTLGTTTVGTLEMLAQKTGNHCQLLPDPALAVGIVPGVIASELTSISATLDGAAVAPPTTTPSLPRTGPTAVDWSATLSGLVADHPYTYCVDAHGSDGKGTGESGDVCTHFTLKAPPTITGPVDDPSTGAIGAVPEGSPFALSTTVEGATSLSWTETGGTGTCAFGDPSAASTSVTCTDDGHYTLTLTATDNATPAQTTTFTAHLDVTNVAPDATMNVGPASVPLSAATVHAHVAMTDPGADAWSCTFDWGDSSTTTTAPSTTAVCDADHTYTAPGSYSVSVHVVDGDGGSDDDLGSVQVKAPPALTGLPTDGPGGAPGGTVAEGSPFAIGGSVAGATSVHWTGGAGHCTFTVDAVPTSVTCDDNGTYELTLTAVDGFGQTSTSSFHLLVTNVEPTLLVTSPAAGSSPRTVTFTGNVFDPGTGDTHTCTINWGDGSPAETVAAIGGTCTAAHTYAASVTSAMIVATASDDDGAVSDPVMRALNFNRPPVCSAVAPNIAVLWPANHKLVLITLSGATDPDGNPLTYTITGVRQDEALNGAGDGDTARDAQLASGGSVWIRAERSGTGDGRVYTIQFTVGDGAGASCSGSALVSVPHSVNKPAVKTPGVNVNSLG